jgi:TIR domain
MFPTDPIRSYINLSFAKKSDELSKVYAEEVVVARLKYQSPSGMRLRAIMQPAVESARARIDAWVQIVRDACKEANRPVDNEVRAYILAEVHNQCEGARRNTAHNLTMTLQREPMQHVPNVRESLSANLDRQISQIETDIARELKIEELRENVQKSAKPADRLTSMSAPHSPERRRSMRLTRAVPLTVTSTDFLGQPFTELTTTITVNRYGCTYQSKHHVPKNAKVTLEVVQPGSAAPAHHIEGRVAWVQRPHTVRELFQIALEFEKPTDIWGVTLPSGDRFIPGEGETDSVPLRSPQKIRERAVELMDEVREVIVEESADDRTENHRSASSQPRKPEASIKKYRKKRTTKKKRKTRDVFICHASEDKDSFVRPLAEALRAEGLRVWYDEFTLRVGDGLRRSIDKGLAASKFGAVVVSPSFFKKQWPQRELDGLVAREIDDRRVILPVWHNVSLAEVRERSITLADRIAANSEEGIQAVVAKLLLVIRKNG